MQTDVIVMQAIFIVLILITARITLAMIDFIRRKLWK